MPRKYRLLAALLGILLLLTMALPVLADEPSGLADDPSYSETGGDIMPPDGDDSPILPPDDEDPSSDPGQDPGGDPTDDPSSDPSTDPGDNDPAPDDPDNPDGDDPGFDDPDNPDGDDPDIDDPDNPDDPDASFFPEPGEGDGGGDMYTTSDDDYTGYTGGTVTNTAPGSTGSTTPRRIQQILGGSTSEGDAGTGGDSTQQTAASAEVSGPQYVTFARLNLRSNSMSLTLFYGGAGCIALGGIGLIILLLVLVRSRRKNHRDRLIQEIDRAENQARSTEAAPAATGKYAASHMRGRPLKHAANKNDKK